MVARVVGVAGVVVLVCAAAPAQAATVSAGGFPPAYVYTAAAGETNDVTLTLGCPAPHGSDCVTIADPGVPSVTLAAGVPCSTGSTPSTVHCPRTDGRRYLEVDLGDGDDTLAVTGNLTTGTTPGLAQATLLVIGGPGDDALNGGPGDEAFRPGVERDSVDGGEGSDWIDYGDQSAALDIDLTHQGARPRCTSNLCPISYDYLFSGIENAAGGGGDDLIIGDGGPNRLRGGEGNDSLAGLGGTDLTDYSERPGGKETRSVTVDLAAGWGIRPPCPGQLCGESDALSSIEGARGGPADDYLFGTTGADVLEGDAGQDTLRGRGGADVLDGGVRGGTASWADSTTPIVADLQAGTATGGAVLRSLHGLEGGTGDDVLTGDGAPNLITGNGGHDVLAGAAGDDRLSGGAGDDRIDGGGGADRAFGDEGSDVVDYSTHLQSVTVPLPVTGGESDAGGAEDTSAFGTADRLASIEGVIGSPADDTLTGTGGDESFDGGAGVDLIKGGGGADDITGGPGADELRGEIGADTLRARDGDVDALDCGSEADTAFADPFDTVTTSCETQDFGPPAAATSAAIGVGQTAATLRGTVNPSRSATTYRFEYGPTTAYGAQTAEEPAGSGTADVAAALDVTGLTPGTTYHYRIVATNLRGSTAGADRTFTTDPAVVAQPSPSPAPQPSETPAPQPSVTPSPAPVASIAVKVGKARLASALSKGIAATATIDTPGRIVATATLPAAVARKLKLKRNVATGRVTATTTGTVKLTLRFTAAAKRKLKRQRSVKLSLRATLTTGQQTAAARASLNLRR